MKRHWFQFHFSTTVVLMLVAAGRCCGEDEIFFADFENGVSPAETAGDVRLSTVAEAPQGKAALKIEVGKASGHCSFSIPENASLSTISALHYWIKIDADAKSKPKLHWVAVNAKGRELFWKYIQCKTGEWVEINEPLANWMLGLRIEDWSEVRRLELWIDNTKAVLLDGMKLKPGHKEAAQARNWLRALAFEKREVRELDEGGIWIATDVPVEEDVGLRSRLKKMLSAQAWFKRTFGDAFHPVDTGRPVAVLIFANKQECAAWRAQYSGWVTLWRTTAEPLDIAAVVYSKNSQGSEYLLAGVHALIARDLRIPNIERANWFQIGTASYLQLCLFPELFKRDNFARHFAHENVRSYFRSLRSVMTEPVVGENYAQVASIVALLIEKHPDWLPQIVRGLVDGSSIQKFLESKGSNFDALEKEWFEWGKATFPEGKAAGPEIFPLPEEFKEP